MRSVGQSLLCCSIRFVKGIADRRLSSTWSTFNTIFEIIHYIVVRVATMQVDVLAEVQFVRNCCNTSSIFRRCVGQSDVVWWGNRVAGNEGLLSDMRLCATRGESN